MQLIASFAILASGASAVMHHSKADDYCVKVCEKTDSCVYDPHAHSSYCKVPSLMRQHKGDEAVCFGLYWNLDGTTCFQPNDKHCDESKPVTCADGKYPTEKPTYKPIEKPHKDDNYCQRICDKVDGCKNDPHHHGSYCKSYQPDFEGQVCFGLYYKPNGGMFFEPNSDHHYPEDKPVMCGDYKPTHKPTTTTTTKKPYTTTTTTKKPYTTTTTAKPYTTTTTTYKPTTTTAHPDNYCQALCDKVDGCKYDPHHHGSYCKSYQAHPEGQVCFGLYYKHDGTMFFEPNSEHHYPEDKPVKC